MGHELCLSNVCPQSICNPNRSFRRICSSCASRIPQIARAQVVNAHSVICAFCALANRESPTSSCILARTRPVKIAPGAYSHYQPPDAHTATTSSWLSQYIDARFPTSASYFSEAATSSPYLDYRFPRICYWIPENVTHLILFCSFWLLSAQGRTLSEFSYM